MKSKGEDATGMAFAIVVFIGFVLVTLGIMFCGVYGWMWVISTIDQRPLWQSTSIAIGFSVVSGIVAWINKMVAAYIFGVND